MSTYHMPGRLSAHREVKTQELAKQTTIDAVFQVGLLESRVHANDPKFHFGNAGLVQSSFIDVL